MPRYVRSTSKNQLYYKISPYIYPHVESQSSRAPPWSSPPACCGLVLQHHHHHHHLFVHKNAVYKMTMYNWRTGHARLGTCQSLRGRFSRLTFLPRELSTNNNNYLSIYLSYLSIDLISIAQNRHFKRTSYITPADYYGCRPTFVLNRRFLECSQCISTVLLLRETFGRICFDHREL